VSNSFLYDEKLFVNREREIRQICELIDKFKELVNSRQKVIAVHGQRGAGKTWFSLHLHRTVFKRPEYQERLESCLVALSPAPVPDRGPQNDEFLVVLSPGNKQSDEATVLELLKQLIKRYSPQDNVSTYDLYECSSWLVRYLSSNNNNDTHLFVLIVDSYMESPAPLQKLFETYLLAPLAPLDRCLLILTGRGGLRPSMNLSLLPRSDATIALASFVSDGVGSDAVADLIRTALQVEKQDADKMAKTVTKLGGSYPLAIRQLADFVKKFASELHTLPPASPLHTLPPVSPPTPEFCQEFSTIVDNLLSLSGPDAERKRTRTYFEALCILDGFREVELKELLSAQSQSPLSNAEARAVMSTLLQTALIEFRDNRYHIHDSIQPILEKYLYICKPETWDTLQGTAAAMYEKWAGGYPQHRLEFERRRQRHIDALGKTALAV
jgi:hypothetical protein